jgi:hypothetical protein
MIAQKRQTESLFGSHDLSLSPVRNTGSFLFPPSLDFFTPRRFRVQYCSCRRAEVHTMKNFGPRVDWQNELSIIFDVDFQALQELTETLRCSCINMTE